MSDKPEVTSATAPQTTDAPDVALNARRLLTWALAAITGGALTVVTFLATNIPLDSTLLISFVEVPFLPLAGLPMVLLCFIWVDYFLGTRILPD